MKVKFIVILAMLMTSFQGIRAQWIVTDPVNLAQNIINSINQIVETSTTAVNTINTFKETAKIFQQGKEIYDALKRVQKLIKDARKVQETVRMVADIADTYLTNFKLIISDRNFTPDEVTAIGNGYTILIREGQDMLLEIKDIVSENGLSFNDAERMEIIDRVHQRIRRHKALVDYYTRKNISVSYVRARKNGDTERVLSLYGNTGDRYW